MKLFERYNRLNLIATITIFVVGSCAFYFLLNYILLNQLDETLQTEQQEVTNYVKSHNALPEVIPTKDQHTTFEQVQNEYATSTRTVRYRYNKEEENRREIKFTTLVNGQYYLVKVTKPLEETEQLLQVIIGVTVIIIALILLTGYLINRTVIMRLWQPFYSTIDKVNAYHLSDQQPLQLAYNKIDEFNLLNQSINKMEERIQQDYSSLKDFTGQAAHEIQTPLSIIRNKLDALMQDENFSEKNSRHITDIEKSVSRLSKLHQSLLLLTKIENKQFALNEEVLPADIIKEKHNEYSELAEVLGIKTILALEPIKLIFHKHLAEIVINNLMSNATKYNKPGGTINITLTAAQLSIANTSVTGPLDQQKVFKRFYKDNAHAESNGLGLSIVKQICEVAGYTIGYEYAEEHHIFFINF